MVLYINYANHSPGVNFGQAKFIVGKHSNISISEVSRDIDKITHTASLGSWKGCMLFGGRSKLNCSCHGNIYMLMGKIKKKKIFSESSRPTALVFGMWQ